MSIETVYVKAKSKKAINETIASGQRVYGTIYSMFNGDREVDLATMPDGTVIKIFDKYVSGQPYAKAYGNVAHKKDGALYLK